MRIRPNLRGRKSTFLACKYLQHQLHRPPQELKQRFNAKLTCRKKRRGKLAENGRIECRFLRSGAAPCCAERNQPAERRRDQTARARERKTRGRKNTKRAMQVLAASLAQTNPKAEAAAERQAHPPLKAKRGGTTNGAVGGRVQRLVGQQLERRAAVLLQQVAHYKYLRSAKLRCWNCNTLRVLAERNAQNLAAPKDRKRRLQVLAASKTWTKCGKRTTRKSQQKLAAQVLAGALSNAKEKLKLRNFAVRVLPAWRLWRDKIKREVLWRAKTPF